MSLAESEFGCHFYFAAGGAKKRNGQSELCRQERKWVTEGSNQVSPSPKSQVPISITPLFTAGPKKATEMEK